MLATRAESLELLRCPRTLKPLRRLASNELGSVADPGKPEYRYPVVDGLPILVDFEASVMDEQATLARSVTSVVPRRKYTGLAARAYRLVAPPNPKSARNVRRFVGLLKQDTAEPTVLIVGGATVGDGMQRLYDDPTIKVHAFDMYRTSNIQFIADAHRIPLPDGSVDGVVIQAVLELVLDPAAVVAEIKRVLRPRGLVYAETPFMQQVHEGAYDFTRFTDSGHRYLFRGFDLVASGVTSGAGVQLLWTLDFFARSLFRSRTAGKLAKVGFFWLRYLDRLIPESYAVDTASGFYFLGRSSDHPIGPKEIVAYYRGADR